MEYNVVEEKFKLYIEKCRQILKDKLLNRKNIYKMKEDKEENIDLNTYNSRINMINIKIDHTMRMIEKVIRTNELLNLKFDFQLVIKVAVLYHDIGRFRQATWSDSFSDDEYANKNFPFINHGYDGYDIFLNEDFAVDEQYIPIIGESIKHHVNIETAEHLHYRYDTDVAKININDIVTGKLNLTEAECHAASLITQLVSDIDKIDILYQYLTPNCDFIRDYLVDKSNDTLDNIAKKWGIDKKEIIEYNQIDEPIYKPKAIRIPIQNVEISKLEIPDYMKEMFYNNTWPELNDLKKDPNWNFITVLWWRLSHFLNNINFNSILITAEEMNLIESIEKTIPEKLKPVFKEAFEYTEEVLIRKTIKNNQDGIYIKKRI